MARSRVEIHVERPFQLLVGKPWLRKLARETLKYEGMDAVAVSLVVTDDETVQGLNATYRGQDTTTDVLSFSLREGETLPPPPDGLTHIGEVIISYPQAARQAGERPVSQEVAHLAVHGLLHLAGYDHQDDEAEARMRAREQAVLLSLRGVRGTTKQSGEGVRPPAGLPRPSFVGPRNDECGQGEDA